MSADDSKALDESNTLLESATRNADRGMLNREMATAEVNDVKTSLITIDGHLKTQMADYDKPIASDDP